MKKRKIFPFIVFLALFSFLCGHAFAGTGGAGDGQVLLLVILVVLLVVTGILYFFPLLVHRIRDLWNKYHHC